LLRDPVPLLKRLAKKQRDDHFRHRLGLAGACLAELSASARNDQVIPDDGGERQSRQSAFSVWLAHHLRRVTSDPLMRVRDKIASGGLLLWWTHVLRGTEAVVADFREALPGYFVCGADVKIREF